MTAEAIDRTLAAVAEPHRRRVVDLLRERPRRAGELAAAVGLSPAALSRHLRVLRASGLVEESHPELDARVRVYALRAEPVAGLRAWLDETEVLWSRQLRAFKAHVGAHRGVSSGIAFTRAIGAWWRPNDLFRFTPQGAGTLAFEGGPGGRLIELLPNGESFAIGWISAWEPGVRLAFSWRQASFTADQCSHVEVRFEPVGNETRVTVEHHGWDAVPQEHVARHGFPPAIFLRRHGERWQALLSSYKATAKV